MSRVRLIFAAFIVVLSVNATVSSSAMATFGWLINGTLLVGFAPFASTFFVDEKARWGFGTTEISCSGSTLSAVSPEMDNENHITFPSLIFPGCSVTSSGECTLASGSTIGTLPLLSEATLDGPLGVRGVFKPRTVNTIATIKLEGANCAETGKLPITGAESWLMPTGQDERTWQLVSFNVLASSGELKIGSTAASLKASILFKLASSLPWSFM
jgi:hypothetical protein